MSEESGRPPAIYYEVDPSTNPSTWPGPIPGPGTHIGCSRVDVHFININSGSDFRSVRTGTNEPTHHAVLQVAKHVARGLYRIISLCATEYSCVVVLSTEIPRDELMFKNGFPWDREDEQLPEVVLK